MTLFCAREKRCVMLWEYYATMQKQLLKILVKISQTWPFRNFEKNE